MTEVLASQPWLQQRTSRSVIGTNASSSRARSKGNRAARRGSLSGVTAGRSSKRPSVGSSLRSPAGVYSERARGGSSMVMQSTVRPSGSTGFGLACALVATARRITRILRTAGVESRSARAGARATRRFGHGHSLTGTPTISRSIASTATITTVPATVDGQPRNGRCAIDTRIDCSRRSARRSASPTGPTILDVLSKPRRCTHEYTVGGRIEMPLREQFSETLGGITDQRPVRSRLGDLRRCASGGTPMWGSPARCSGAQ